MTSLLKAYWALFLLTCLMAFSFIAGLWFAVGMAIAIARVMA